MNNMKSVTVYDIPSGIGGTFTVSIKEMISETKALVRVWYGKATHRGWESWKDFDGYTFTTDIQSLSNKRTLDLHN